MRKSATPSSTVSTAPSSAAPEASPADGSAAMAAASASSLATSAAASGLSSVPDTSWRLVSFRIASVKTYLSLAKHLRNRGSSPWNSPGWQRQLCILITVVPSANMRFLMSYLTVDGSSRGNLFWSRQVKTVASMGSPSLTGSSSASRAPHLASCALRSAGKASTFAPNLARCASHSSQLACRSGYLVMKLRSPRAVSGKPSTPR
mmetsp:Transcript_71159/g.161040  ORF Transcript_71159/g.161040 Transcript_71159/m.161040 type:complete len:205 (-) Transcript_71159:393-1007(-)